jgi:hypothetical protein
VPLGRIDFQNIPTFEPVPPGNYDGATESWEAKDTKAGDSTNIEGKFRFQYLDGDGNETSRSIIARWNLKPGALWRLSQDLVNMGVDPSELKSDSVDLEAILNQVFGPIPTPVTLTITQRTWQPPDGGDAQIRNEISSVKLREV